MNDGIRAARGIGRRGSGRRSGTTSNDFTEARAWGAALTLVLLVLILNIGARLLAKLFQPKAR